MNAGAEVPAVRSVLDLADYDHPDCLIYGIGNVGRQDDGLGWAFVDWLEQTALCVAAEKERHYQLQLEDADLISQYRRVLFVDATRCPEVEDFRLECPSPALDYSFTSHALSVPALLATCRQCFDRLPETRLLVLRGYEWALKQGLSAGAERNLYAAQAALADFSTH